jgi:hypothetical protein
VALDRYRQVDVVVRDAETGKPVPAANVRISYPTARSSFAPHEAASTTSPDGVARIDVAPYAESCILLEVGAAGYISYPRDVCAEVLRQTEPDSWFAAKKHPPLQLAVAMLAEPRFCIEWIVPTGFRGLIKAEVKLDDQLQCPPAQRCLRFEVPPSGQVQIAVPGGLQHYPPAYRARYADGTPLSEDVDALKIGFQWLKRDGDYEYFVVGTRVDFESYRRENSSQRSNPEPQSSDSGKGHGRGNRRNRANPSESPAP